MGFKSKCSIENGQVVNVKKSKSNIVDMWLNPLDRVTYAFLVDSTKKLKKYTLSSWYVNIVATSFSQFWNICEIGSSIVWHSFQ